MSRWASGHFSWDELRCKGCAGECSFSEHDKPLVNIQDEALQKLEQMRCIVDKPFMISSACRCPLHNARVRGAPMSQHRATDRRPSTAFDIAYNDIPKHVMYAAAKEVGFGGIGSSYTTFIHVDNRRKKTRW